MDSKENLSYNPWACFLGIDTIDYTEVAETSVKSKSTVTKLNYEDMSLFGLCPVYEDLHLTICKICESILIPQALKAHMELRHGAKVKKKVEEELPESSSTKPKAVIPPAAWPSSNSGACSSSSSATTSASSECSSSYSACSSSSVRSPDSSAAAGSFMALAQPSTEAKPSWPFSVNLVHGATLPQSFLNTNANIVRVKPENSKLKVLNVPYCGKVEPNSLIKNVPTKKTVSHKKELASAQQPRSTFPELASSNLPSLPSGRAALSKANMTLMQQEIKEEPNSVYSPVPPASSPSSSESSTTDNSESSSQKKAPALEKLVLRRVLQTGPNTSAVRRPTFQKGMKGIARNKKDSSAQETYFMVVKQKDRQQNLLAARQHIRKQSNVAHKEKCRESDDSETEDLVEQKLNHLESVRDKLITQLIQELQAVKQKLHQSSVSKSELNKELVTVRSQLAEARRMNEIQTETLSKQNSDYKKEIQDLKDKIDILTANTSSFLEQQQMANQACNLPDDDILRKHLQFCEEQKFEFQKRLEKLESELKDFKKFSSEEKKRLDLKVRQYANIISELKRRLDLQITQNEELRTQKDMLEKHLSPEIRFQVKSQIANFQAQQEIYPSLAINESSIPSPAVPFAEKYLTDLRNIEYCAFQHQMAND